MTKENCCTVCDEKDPFDLMIFGIDQYFNKIFRRYSRWCDSLVVSVLVLGSEDPRFEPVDRRCLRSKRDVGQLLFASWALAYSTIHP